MKYSELQFKKTFLGKDKELNEDRPYIDFIIDSLSLANHLEIGESDITPFGWGNNLELETKSAKRLLTFKKSEFPNGLQSAYVCARCGDEGCGAIMFDIINHGAYIEWKNFVSSDGYPNEAEPDEKISEKSFYFKIGNYHIAINKLLKLIKENN